MSISQEQKIQVPVITVDGPSGSGKGTLAKRVASGLGWHFLDSGALYRILAYLINQKNVDLSNIVEICHIAEKMEITFSQDASGRDVIFMEGDNIASLIRSEKIGGLASQVAVLPDVRQALLVRQHCFQKPPGLVADGRDMGTVVFPFAQLKIFLIASAEVRAQRRVRQLESMGLVADFNAVLEEIKLRDLRDRERAAAPLKAAIDAVVIDSSFLTADKVLDHVLMLAHERNLPSFMRRK